MKKARIKYIVFIVYILVLLKLTIFRETTMEDYGINLALFSDLINVYKTRTTWQFLRLFLGNIGWFVPFGFLLPMMKKSTFLKVTLGGFGFSLLIEIMQLVFKKGFFEVDDLILNTAGAMIGYAAYKAMMWCKNQVKAFSAKGKT